MKSRDQVIKEIKHQWAVIEECEEDIRKIEAYAAKHKDEKSVQATAQRNIRIEKNNISTCEAIIECLCWVID